MYIAGHHRQGSTGKSQNSPPPKHKQNPPITYRDALSVQPVLPERPRCRFEMLVALCKELEELGEGKAPTTAVLAAAMDQLALGEDRDQ